MGVICGVYAPQTSFEFRQSVLNLMNSKLDNTPFVKHVSSVDQSLSLTFHEHPKLRRKLNEVNYLHKTSEGEWLFGDLNLLNRSALSSRAEDSDHKIVAQWLGKNGDAAAADLVGDFCLVRYRKDSSAFTFIRDTIGVKSMFFHKTDFGFIFASIPQPIVDLQSFPKCLSRHALGSFMVIQHPGRTRTHFDDLFEVSTASITEVVDGAVRDISHYWQVAPCSDISSLSDEEKYQRLQSEFERSIEQRLDQERGRSGLQLSGGLDSSTIAGTMCKLRPEEPINTFSSVLREGYSGSARDERNYIQSVLERWPQLSPTFLDDKNHEILSGNSFWHEWFCAPNPDLFYNVNMAIEEAVETSDTGTLILGLGGDEGISAWGLPAMTEFFYLGKFGKAWAELNRLQSRYSGGSKLKIAYGKLMAPLLPNWLRGIPKGLQGQRWEKEYLLNSKLAKSSEFLGHLKENGFSPIQPAFFSMQEYERSNLTTFDHYSLYAYDFAANLRGYRVQFPLIDHKLLDCVLAMPLSMKVSSKLDRMLLRELGKGLVPNEVRLRNDKLPFYPGFADALHRSSRSEKDFLKSASINKLVDILDLDAVRKLRLSQSKKVEINMLQVFALMQFLEANSN